MSTTSVLHIEGMTCQHCVQAVTAELASVAGVVSVDVDLDTAWAEVVAGGDVSEATLRAAVEAAGYQLS